MKKKELPPIEVLNKIFSYNPRTGLLKKKAKYVQRDTGTLRLIHQEYTSHLGYRYVFIRGFSGNWYSHRVIYKIMTGTDPGQYDVHHKNGKRSDNRWENLELLTHQQNMDEIVWKNRKAKSGHAGVYQNGKRWGAYGPGTKYIGNYVTKEEAIAARQAA